MEKTALIILDGWGMGQPNDNNAVHVAQTPCFDRVVKEHPHARLTTHGEQVGLPEGQMGNSEVGHMNIGAGRIVWQDLCTIDNAIEDGTIEARPALVEHIDALKRSGGCVAPALCIELYGALGGARRFN